MTVRTPPRAPWYSSATRRLALVRVGLPTLVACLVAMGPGVAAQAPDLVPPQAAAIVTEVTTSGPQSREAQRGDRRERGEDRERGDGRSSGRLR